MGDLFHTGELDAIAAEFEDGLLPDTCTIERRTRSSDGGGGFTDVWATLASGVECRIAPVGGGEAGTSGDRAADETTHVVTLPAGQDITAADRFVISTVTYEVLLVRRRGVWEIHRRVEVKEAP